MGQLGSGSANIPKPGKLPRNCRVCGNLFSTDKCNKCIQEKSRRWRAANQEYMQAERLKTATERNAKERDRYEANKEEINTNKRALRLSNPEKFPALTGAAREKRRLDARAWRLAHPGRADVTNRLWRSKNAEYIAARRIENRSASREYDKLRRLKYPEIAKNYNIKRRVKMLISGGEISKGLKVRLFKLQRGKCACCGKALGSRYHLDHIMPLALGGGNVDSNIQLLRALCNLQKSKKHPVDFMQQRGFLI